MRSVLGLLMVLAACTSNPSGGVVGTVTGKQFVMVDSVSSSVMPPLYTGAQIVMTSTANACADIANNVLHPNETSVSIFVTDWVNGEPAAPSGPGTYPIVVGTDPYAGRSAMLSTNIVEATCGHDGHDASKTTSAVSGTVTLTAVSDQLSGTFDVMLDSGDHITGSFDPQTCAAFGNVPIGSPSCE